MGVWVRVPPTAFFRVTTQGGVPELDNGDACKVSLCGFESHRRLDLLDYLG